jgi:hypothetical protein
VLFESPVTEVLSKMASTCSAGERGDDDRADPVGDGVTG